LFTKENPENPIAEKGQRGAREKQFRGEKIKIILTPSRTYILTRGGRKKKIDSISERE